MKNTIVKWVTPVLASLAVLIGLLWLTVVWMPHRANTVAAHGWQSKDGNAMIMYCDPYIQLTVVREDLQKNWRPATMRELYDYKDEIPYDITVPVYAGASLYRRTNQVGGKLVSYVKGYIPKRGIEWEERLNALNYPNLMMVVRKDLPRKGTWANSIGKTETIGVLDIPTL